MAQIDLKKTTVEAKVTPEGMTTWSIQINLDRNQVAITFFSPDNMECIGKHGNDDFNAYYRPDSESRINVKKIGTAETLEGAYELIVQNRERLAEYAVAEAYR